jgi:hypothetical protein
MLHAWLQAYVFFSVFNCYKCMFQVFHRNVVYILQWLHTCFSGVSDVCCKCFSRFRTYVASASSGCCKNRSSVAHVVMGSTCRRACAWEAEGMVARARSVPACACSRAQDVVIFSCIWDPIYVEKNGSIALKNYKSTKYHLKFVDMQNTTESGVSFLNSSFFVSSF